MKPTLLVGSRNMSQDGVPKKSSFGHKFSNFWFHLETGVNLPDTQSGYRLYPLHHIPKKYYTEKFEFEIEILVRSSWNGVQLKKCTYTSVVRPRGTRFSFSTFPRFYAYQLAQQRVGTYRAFLYQAA